MVTNGFYVYQSPLQLDLSENKKITGDGLKNLAGSGSQLDELIFQDNIIDTGISFTIDGKILNQNFYELVFCNTYIFSDLSTTLMVKLM